MQHAIEMTSDFDFRDDGYIELVLRILGLMCDNQHRELQVNKSNKTRRDDKVHYCSIILLLSDKTYKNHPTFHGITMV
jgi:hypothetical protein